MLQKIEFIWSIYSKVFAKIICIKEKQLLSLSVHLGRKNHELGGANIVTQ